MKIYILSQGWRNNSNRCPIAAFRTKKLLRSWVSKNFPHYEAKSRIHPNEMYWESEFGWLRVEDEPIKVIE